MKKSLYLYVLVLCHFLGFAVMEIAVYGRVEFETILDIAGVLIVFAVWKVITIFEEKAEAKWEEDCCEWWFDKTQKFWRCSCEEGSDYEVDSPEDYGYKYCPYCGRKISEVE